MLQDGSNYVWQLAWVINEVIPRYARLFSPHTIKGSNQTQHSDNILIQHRQLINYSVSDPRRETLLHGRPWGGQLGKLLYALYCIVITCSPKICFPACATFSRHTMLTAKVKKVMKMHICISRPERAKRFWIVFLTLMVHKLRIELPKNIFVPSLIINGLFERKKMRILSCSNLNYLSLCKILYILLLSTLSYFSSRSWVWMRRREKTNGVELCPDCAYSLGWIILFKIKYLFVIWPEYWTLWLSTVKRMWRWNQWWVFGWPQECCCSCSPAFSRQYSQHLKHQNIFWL